MISYKELRNLWLSFYQEHNHLVVEASSLIELNAATQTLFNVAGMQAILPYLLGAEHPSKEKCLCNIQGCVRTNDLAEVGDTKHFTFFEMLGNWSLNAYFKKTKIDLSYEFLTKILKLKPELLYVTLFSGDTTAPRDLKSAELLLKKGIREDHIVFLSKEDNWWELPNTLNTPCGPDCEWFYPLDVNNVPNFNENPDAYLEIGNDVFMEYTKTKTGYESLGKHNVDTGFGLERLLMVTNSLSDPYLTSLFKPALDYLIKLSKKDYFQNLKAQKAMRIIVDHIRTVTMLLGDKNEIKIANVGAGYVLRRLIRRALRYLALLEINDYNTLLVISQIFIEIYAEAYPQLKLKERKIISDIQKECQKFQEVLKTGTKLLYKELTKLRLTNNKIIPGTTIFKFYDSYGFPVELITEIAQEEGFTYNLNEYQECINSHQQESKKNFLSKQQETNTLLLESALHTATHILLGTLRFLLGKHIVQKGSHWSGNILSLDFNSEKHLTTEELEKIENFVNVIIKKELPITKKIITYQEAQNQAYGIFKTTDLTQLVSIYCIGNFDIQICAGPHLENTKEIKYFKILKEQSVSQGIKRIKAQISIN